MRDVAFLGSRGVPFMSDSGPVDDRCDGDIPLCTIAHDSERPFRPNRHRTHLSIDSRFDPYFPRKGLAGAVSSAMLLQYAP